MQLSIRQQIIYWTIAAVVFFGILWFLGGIITPFLLGAALAYFLDPVADMLERWGLSRGLATAIITLVGVIIFLAFLLIITPLLFNQAVGLFNGAPKAFGQFHDFLLSHFPQVDDADSLIRQTLDSVGKTIQSKGVQLAESLLTSVGSFLSIVMLFIIVPVVAVYLLLDWDRMVASIDGLLPRDIAPTVRRLANDIDRTLAGYIRGMGTVCLVLGTYYSVVLMLTGLQYGLFIGAFAGLITFIPYVGATLGAMIAIGMGIVQYWGDWWHVAMIAAVFFAGQIAEGNFITPRLVGHSIGLHPVWLIFALSVFGSLFGFVGMLAAVPFAACIGVIARFFIERYKQSNYYDPQNNPAGDQDLQLPD